MRRSRRPIHGHLPGLRCLGSDLERVTPKVLKQGTITYRVNQRNKKKGHMDNTEKPQPGSNPRDYLDQLQNSVGANRDTEGLGTMVVGGGIIGRIDEINGEDGKEMPEFVATTHELKQLAGYWAKERIKHDFDYFVYQSSGSREWRWSVYIGHQLSRLAELLGKEAMRGVWDNAVASFREHNTKITDEDWRIFTKGSENEREAWRNKVWGEEGGTQGVRQAKPANDAIMKTKDYY